MRLGAIRPRSRPATPGMSITRSVDSDAAVSAQRAEGASEPHRRAVQIVSVRSLDLHVGDLADSQGPPARDIDGAVDLRSVGFAAALGDGRPDFVDDHLLASADFPFQAPR